jgi:FkbM family methyltransferase
VQKRDGIVLANKLLAPLRVRLESERRIGQLECAEVRLDWLASLCAHHPEPETLPRAQLGQDLFALWATSFKRGGFFVEFGATNGIDLSNTALLERSFEWHGIVAEPARGWHADLRRHRHCIIDQRCLWSRSGESLTFTETPEAELSTVSQFAGRHDGHQDRRRSGTEYEVETVSLNDLLDQHAAPSVIDYLSVDTEGSEYEILSAFDFSREISVLTVEHSNDPIRRDQLLQLLTGHGFCRVLERISLFDDWYVSPRLMPLG